MEGVFRHLPVGALSTGRCSLPVGGFIKPFLGLADTHSFSVFCFLCKGPTSSLRMLVLLGGAVASRRGVCPYCIICLIEGRFFSPELWVLGWEDGISESRAQHVLPPGLLDLEIPGHLVTVSAWWQQQG